MNSGDILRYIMILFGIVIFAVTTMSLSKRRMTEPFCLAWGFFSLLLVLGGILLRPSGISSYISDVGLILILLIGGLIIVAAYWLSRQVSTQIRRNQELTMQVSLLNEEMGRLKMELAKQGKAYEEDTICH